MGKHCLIGLLLISLCLSACASKSFVRKEIQGIEKRTVNNEARITQLEDRVTEVEEEIPIALSLANRALWKDKVTVTEFIPYLAEREVRFAFDSYGLGRTAKATLDGIGRTLRLNPGYRLTIEGHTDSIASNVYNQDLGRRRAEEVKRYLIEKFGIPLYRISSLTFGESAPKTSNATDAGRAENRRVVLQLYMPE